MTATSHIPGISDELIASVAEEAERSADSVGLFLRELKLVGTPERPIPLPRDFLLEVGAALQLLEWESLGLTPHREAGLPNAMDALRDAFRLLSDQPRENSELPTRVLALFVERFAWHARRTWNAPVLLDLLSDDKALDAVAEFLWSHRHDGIGSNTLTSREQK